MALVETKRALVVARTYPVPVPMGIESSCTAAITDEGEWLRLFPVPWRLLPNDQRFRKYQWIEARVVKAADDPRRESHHLQPDGIRVLSEPLSTKDAWRGRKDVVLPLLAQSLCGLQAQRDAHQYPTLGFVQPAKITRFRSEAKDPRWTDAQLAMLRQQHLFVEPPERELEKIPFNFYYSFICQEPDCSGHNMICTDWELSESFRKWRAQYAVGWEEKFRMRYENEMIRKNDTCFFVGTMASHPGSWIIIGLFYPPRVSQPSLF